MCCEKVSVKLQQSKTVCWKEFYVKVGKSGDKQHQISRGDNYNKFYLLLLFDHRGFGVWG